MGVSYGMVPNTLLALGTDQHFDMIAKFGNQDVCMSVL